MFLKVRGAIFKNKDLQETIKLDLRKELPNIGEPVKSLVESLLEDSDNWVRDIDITFTFGAGRILYTHSKNKLVVSFYTGFHGARKIHCGLTWVNGQESLALEQAAEILENRVIEMRNKECAILKEKERTKFMVFVKEI